MPFQVAIDEAKRQFPEYEFVSALTPSEQKAAFHVRNSKGENFCLKIISPNYSMDRIDREILALGKLSHRNIVKLKEYTFSAGDVQRHYMVEEFVEGSDLAKLVNPPKQLCVGDTISLFAKLADGLEALRQQNIVHRDLKPTNIRVRPDGTPVIIDFGLARHLDLPDLTLTGQGAAFGTPKYFAPEQAEDGGSKRNIEHRTDIFALGVIFYEMTVGTHPFWAPGMSVAKLRHAICTSKEYLKAVPFVVLPANLRLIITKMLEKERVKRLHSGGVVRTMLSRLEGN